MRIFDPDRYLEAEASPDDRRRARRVLIYAFALTAQAAGFGVFFLLRGIHQFAVVIGIAMVLCAATPLILRWTRSPMLAGNWLQCHIAWALCWCTYHSAAEGGVTVWFVLLPLLALFANGRRAGVAWAGISGACVSIVYLMELLGHRFPQLVDPTTLEWVEWASLLSIIAGTLWVVLIYEAQQERSHDELRGALEEADAASRVKSAFLANTSHELRTPMNGVVGVTSLLMTTELSTEQREYVETIHESAESLLSVIDDILDFSQLDAGKLQLAQVEFEPRDRLETLLSLLAERAAGRPLDLVSIVDPAVPDRLIGDPVRFLQVVTNLLDNALKFTEQGEIVLDAGVVRLDGDELELKVSISDTGIGIAAQDQLKIFDRFMQVDSSSARRYGGTGLGLAISKQLVERMGGQIGVESEPGRGSVFRFTARFERGVETGRRRRRSPLELRVLLGPMQRGLASFLTRMLESRGVTLERAATEEELSMRAAEFDLVLVDHDRTPLEGPAVLGMSRTKGAAALTKPVRTAQLDAALERMAQSALDDRKRTCRILVVEDNAVNQLVAATMIERLGYAVDVAASGSEALIRCRDTEYGAIVMDCHMPGMDGFETAAELRRRENDGARTPIIALTASVASEYRVRCLQAGMDDFLTKPVEFDTMQTILSRWVSR